MICLDWFSNWLLYDFKILQLVLNWVNLETILIYNFEPIL